MRTTTWWVVLLDLLPAARDVEPLIAALRDSKPAVRAGPALALGRLRAVPAFATFQKMIEDTDADVRRAAAWALQEIDQHRG